mgnify:CR=1 FL=1
MVKNVLVITLGAGAGACLRWVLSMLLNSIFPAIPLGTVAANFLGGFGIGLSLAQALVSAQGGTLRASNNPDGGARFEIAFPKLVV